MHAGGRQPADELRETPSDDRRWLFEMLYNNVGVSKIGYNSHDDGEVNVDVVDH